MYIETTYLATFLAYCGGRFPTFYNSDKTLQICTQEFMYSLTHTFASGYFPYSLCLFEIRECKMNKLVVNCCVLV